MESDNNSQSAPKNVSLGGTGINKKAHVKPLVARSISNAFMKNITVPLASLKEVRVTKETPVHLFYFLLKVAALELVRRVSSRRFPVLWNSIQGIGILNVPPFKWLQRWAPIKFLAKSTQGLSKPLFFLSIVNSFLGQTDESSHAASAESKSPTDLDQLSDKPVGSDDEDTEGEMVKQEIQENAENNMTRELEIKIHYVTGEKRSIDYSDNEEVTKQEDPLARLKEELEKQGVVLPERLDDDELNRFYIAANGDPSLFLLLVKKTIIWRKTYYFLTPQELESWSRLVFWHAHDIHLRPCLVVRLGLACSSLSPDERPRFAQAVVSQVENGILHLLNMEDRRITVLLDCGGVSAFGVPIHMLKSCSILVQHHFPNRLASLYVVNLSPVLRVLSHAVIQVLKPATREKIHILGEDYKGILSKVLESLPSFLGGDCTCYRCAKSVNIEDKAGGPSHQKSDDLSFLEEEMSQQNLFTSHCGYNNVLRTVIIAILMFWIFVAFFAGFNESDL